jgi:tetratricopeptide (TPR) repeat protein
MCFKQKTGTSTQKDWIIAVLVLPLWVWCGNTSCQDNIGDYLKIISRYYNEGNYSEAVTVCDRVIIDNPEIPEIYYLRGVMNYNLQEYSSAIEDFSIAINLHPGFQEAYHYRAKAKAKNGRYIGALRDLNSARNESLYKTLFLMTGDLFEWIFSGSSEKEVSMEPQ